MLAMDVRFSPPGMKTSSQPDLLKRPERDVEDQVVAHKVDQHDDGCGDGEGADHGQYPSIGHPR